MTKLQASNVGELNNLVGYNDLKAADQVAVQSMVEKFAPRRGEQAELLDGEVEAAVQNLKSFLRVLQSVLTTTSNALDSALSSSPQVIDHAIELFVGELRTICDQSGARPSPEPVDRATSSASQQTPSTGPSSASNRRNSMSTLSSGSNTIHSIAEENEGTLHTPAAAEQPLEQAREPLLEHTVVTQDTVSAESKDGTTHDVTASSSSVFHRIAAVSATPTVLTADTVETSTSGTAATGTPAPRALKSLSHGVAGTGTSGAAGTSKIPAVVTARKSRGLAQLEAALSQRTPAAQAPNPLPRGSNVQVPPSSDHPSLASPQRQSKAISVLKGKTKRTDPPTSTKLSASVATATAAPPAVADTNSVSVTSVSVDNMRILLREQTQARRESLARSHPPPRFKGTTVTPQQLAAVPSVPTMSAGSSSAIMGAGASGGGRVSQDSSLGSGITQSTAGASQQHQASSSLGVTIVV